MKNQQDRFCCDGKCNDCQGRGGCPLDPPFGRPGFMWLVILVIASWSAVIGLLWAVLSTF